MSVAEKLRSIKYWCSIDGQTLTIADEAIADKVKGEKKLEIINTFGVKLNFKKNRVIVDRCMTTKMMCSVMARILDVPFVAEQMFSQYKDDDEDYLAMGGDQYKPKPANETPENVKEVVDNTTRWKDTMPNKRRQPVRRPEASIEENFMTVTAKTSQIRSLKEDIAKLLCLDANKDFHRIIFKY